MNYIHFHQYENCCKFSDCSENIKKFRIRGNCISNLILVTHRGGISGGSITVCRTRPSFDQKGQLTPQGDLPRPPDLRSQGHLCDVYCHMALDQPCLYTQAVLWQSKGAWTCVPSRRKPSVGFGVEEISQKFHSNFVPWV